MNMNSKIPAKTDYSSLFSGLNTYNNNSINNMSWVSDYKSIKNGSYGKLMKAYYSDDIKSDVTKSEVAQKLPKKTTKLDDSETTKTYNKVSADADSLSSSAKALSELKAESDKNSVYSAVNSYVKDYNSLMSSVKDVDNKSIDNNITAIKNYTAENKDALSRIGITVGSDGKLTLDKEKLDAADVKDVNSVFAKRGSYGYSVSVSAEMAKSTANYNATKTATYTNTGAYSAATGTLWDSTT